MASESEGESDAQFTECQTPGCNKRGLKEEVTSGLKYLISGFTHFFSFSVKENIFALDYVPLNTGNYYSS